MGQNESILDVRKFGLLGKVKGTVFETSLGRNRKIEIREFRFGDSTLDLGYKLCLIDVFFERK